MKKSLDPGEWLKRADMDFRTAEDAVKDDAEELADSICYLCQQSAEKYLKAFLLSRGWILKKIHDLNTLLAEAGKYDPSFSPLVDRVRKLYECSMSAHYPLDNAADLTKADALSSSDTLRDLAGLIKTLMRKPASSAGQEA